MIHLENEEGRKMWPGILVPIIIFFGLSVFMGSSIAGMALENIKKQ